MRVMRQFGFFMLVMLSLGVVGYAIYTYAFLPVGSRVHPEMQAVYEVNKLGIYAHVFGSAVALCLGPFQFSTKLRSAAVGVHRMMGRLYLGVGVLIGGLSGLYMGLHAYGGVVGTGA